MRRSGLKLLLVQRSAYDEVVSRLADLASRITLGQPLDASTQVGPLQNSRQLEQVSRLVGAATGGSATAVHGGSPVHLDGGFYYPRPCCRA